MSEGTPGRGPDADSRTDTGDGQAPTNGRPTAPPVRYGPRNGSPSNGASARPVSSPSSPQQYRAPQPPRQSGGPPSNGTPTNAAPAGGTPGSYTRPRTNGAPTRPEPAEQERLVAEARIAAAARNASAAKVRGGSALSGSRTPTVAEPKADVPSADASASVDETAVIPAVAAEDTVVAEPTGSATTPAEETPTADKGRGMLGRLRPRDRRAAQEPAVPPASAEPTVAAVAITSPEAKVADLTTDEKAGDKIDQKTTDKTADESDGESSETAERESAAEATTVVPADQAGTAERTLTWRDRLGLPPKGLKTPPADDPAAEGTTTGTAAGDTTVRTAAAAGAAGVVGGAAVTAATQTAPVEGRVSPSPFAPGGSSDTVVFPAVDAAAAGAAVPAAQATAQPAAPAAAPKPKVGAARRTRKARLRLSRVDPWSVMKTALLFSIAAGIILVVATYGVWSVLNASGLFDAVNDMVKSVVSTPGDTTPFRIEEYVNTQKIIGVAALIAVVDVLIFTALATLGSFLYNLAATVLGGLEVTLAED